jgi:hypothetical protein
MSCRDGFEILRNWKIAKTKLRLYTPRSLSAKDAVIVDVPEQSLVLRVGSKVRSFDLAGAAFRSLAPEEILPADRERFARTLSVSLRGGDELLLVEESPPAFLGKIKGAIM